MQKGHRLQFKCKECQHPIQFSVFDLEKNDHKISCSECSKSYAFKDETLVRQIKKFETLCRTLCDSEEILGHASVGVDVADRQVKIPFKLLLTRLSSCLDLNIGNEQISIVFRIEPTKDIYQPIHQG